MELTQGQVFEKLGVEAAARYATEQELERVKQRLLEQAKLRGELERKYEVSTHAIRSACEVMDAFEKAVRGYAMTDDLANARAALVEFDRTFGFRESSGD